MPLRTARHAATHIGRYNYGTRTDSGSGELCPFYSCSVLRLVSAFFSLPPPPAPAPRWRAAAWLAPGPVLGAQPEVRDPHAILNSYSVCSIVRLLSPFIFLGLALFYCSGRHSVVGTRIPVIGNGYW